LNVKAKNNKDFSSFNYVYVILFTNSIYSSLVSAALYGYYFLSIWTRYCSCLC